MSTPAAKRLSCQSYVPSTDDSRRRNTCGAPATHSSDRGAKCAQHARSSLAYKVKKRAHLAETFSLLSIFWFEPLHYMTARGPACGALKGLAIIGDAEPVTCARCKQTRAYALASKLAHA